MKSLLTKTDFVNAFICPTKLNYIRFPEKYTDSSEEDEYLQSLSDGGYQVGKLAQLQFEEGIEASYKNEDALVETSNLINQEKRLSLKRQSSMAISLFVLIL